ncbi:hypothetical protein AHAS_Ahas05G0096600 [Arachis hypogaea]
MMVGFGVISYGNRCNKIKVLEIVAITKMAKDVLCLVLVAFILGSSVPLQSFSASFACHPMHSIIKSNEILTVQLYCRAVCKFIWRHASSLPSLSV